MNTTTIGSASAADVDAVLEQIRRDLIEVKAGRDAEPLTEDMFSWKQTSEALGHVQGDLSDAVIAERRQGEEA